MAYGGTVGRTHPSATRIRDGRAEPRPRNRHNEIQSVPTAKVIATWVSPRPAGPRHLHTAACLVIGDGLRPGGRGAPAGQGGEVLVGRRRGAGLTPGGRLISNQFQSGGFKGTNVGEIRCREARPIMDCCGRDQAVGE